MDFSEASDVTVSQAATSMNFSPDVPSRTLQVGSRVVNDSGGFPSVMASPEKKGSCGTATDGLDLASPPPRPPRRSENHDKDGSSSGESAHSHGQLLQLDPPLREPCRIVAFDSEDAATTTATTTPPRATRTTHGPFSSMSASDSATQALFSTTQLLNATTMPPAPSEGSRDSACVFSPSVHRPTVAASGDGLGHDGRAALHEAAGRYESEGVWASDPSITYRSDGPANFTTATEVTPMESVQHPRLSGGDHDRSHVHDERAESDDEDEVGLFQETVLFMNNTLHSLGSTRRTPSTTTGVSATPQPHTPQMRGSSSPVPHTPESLDATPKKPTRDHVSSSDRRHRGGGDDFDECRPDREPDDDGSVVRGAYDDPAVPSARNASAATTTSTRACVTTASASPATTCSTRVPASSASPFLAPRLLHADFPTCTTANHHRSNDNDNRGNANSEYLFIDNHDGTAYLADASLQLDGSYALGQTILLARSNAAASASSSVRRGGRSGGGGDDGDGSGACGAASPVVVPQTADQLPVQREQQAHRPMRGATLAEAATSMSVMDCSPDSPIPAAFHDSFASPVKPSVARVLVRRSPAPARDDAASSNDKKSVGAAACLLPPSFNNSFAFDQTLLVPLADTLRSGYADPVSPASPVPHAPSITQQLDSQRARAARDTRPSRPEQDVIYLVPPGAATATMTADDITQQGWIPVQVVDVLPSATGSPVLGSRAGNIHNNNNNSSPYMLFDGRTASPVPIDPAAPTQPHGNAVEAADVANGESEAEEEKVVREQSLSRLSRRRDASFSLASTLSASTLDCINRRLSYSVSGWASARQRFGQSMSVGDRGSVSSVVLPPATPLTLSVNNDHEGHAAQHPGLNLTTAGAASKDRSRNLSVQLSSGANRGGRDNVEGQWADGRANGSPVPLPPGTPETPQREESPSRCTAVATPVKRHVPAEPESAINAGTVAADATSAEEMEEPIANSLLTSMSYQRPSTMTTSDEYPGDYSMSLPLTSSASQSIGLNGNPSHVRHSNAGSFSTHYHPLQPHQALRAPHPRRVSGATALSQGAAAASFSFSLRTFGELGDQSSGVSAATQHLTSNKSNNASNNVSAAAATSFCTTYCNNTNLGSVPATSLDPASSVSVSGAGLPLSRGSLGASVGSRGHGHPSSAAAAHGVNHFLAHKHRYPQQYAAAAERRRAGLPGAVGAAHVNAASLNADAFAARSGAVSRNLPQHHPYLSVQQQHARHAAAVGRANHGTANGAGPRRSSGAHLVPDTSVFLPWAPLTITPEGSLNLGRSEREAAAAAAMEEGAGRAHMNLIPFNSSLETSTVTTTTTTHTTTTTTTTTTTSSCVADGQSVREVAQLPAESAAEPSPGTRRTLNVATAAAAAVPRADDEDAAESLLHEDGAVNKVAFVSSFLRHAASQAATSVGDGSLSAGSLMTTTTMTTTTTNTTTTTATLSDAGKSGAVSRASMTTAWQLHLQDHSQRFDFTPATAMEATMNQFHGSVSAVSAQEPDPRTPPPSAPLRGRVASDKENGSSAMRASATRKSESVGALRPSGLREGSPANAAGLAGKVRSPSRTATAANTQAAKKNTA